MNLTDQFQAWIQAEINACVQGHDSRIERLDRRMEAMVTCLDVNNKKLESLCETAPCDIPHLASELKRRGQETADLKQELESQARKHDAQLGAITDLLDKATTTNALLEGTLRVMQRQIDALQKTSTDQFHEYLEEEFGGYLRKYGKECGLEDLLDANEIWDMVRDYAKDAMDEKIEAIEGDDEFAERVKDVLRDCL